MTETIGSCPFCKSEKVKIISNSKLIGFNGLDERIEYHKFYVRCNKCYARGGVAGGRVASHYVRLTRQSSPPQWETEDEELKRHAIELWNRRAN